MLGVKIVSKLERVRQIERYFFISEIEYIATMKVKLQPVLAMKCFLNAYFNDI